MLESKFGSGDLISKQISKAHKTYGKIPSPQYGWDGVFLKTNLHIRAITSMIGLSKVEGQAGRMYDQEYLEVISAMLPPQLIFKLDLEDRTRREKFEEIHSAYRHLRRISQDQLCHTQKRDIRRPPHDRTDQNTRLKEPREISRSRPEYRTNPSHNNEEQTDCSAFWRSFAAWKTKNQKYDDTQKLLPPSLPHKKPKVHIHLQAGSVQGPCGIQRQYLDVSIKLERGD